MGVGFKLPTYKANATWQSYSHSTLRPKWYDCLSDSMKCETIRNGLIVAYILENSLTFHALLKADRVAKAGRSNLDK